MRPPAKRIRSGMNPWVGKAVFLLGMAALIAIRVPHDKRAKETRIAESRKGKLERALLVLMTVGFLILPLAYVFTPVLACASYAPRTWALACGGVCLAASLWVFHRSHADLGRNWSVSLELRADHQLVESGMYGLVRHPMYSALFLYAIAQCLLLANWIAGPSCLAAFTIMFACRIGREERMMMDRFGEQYRAYRGRTRRVVPWVW